MGIVGALGATLFKLIVLPQVGRAGELPEVVEAATKGAWKIARLGVVALLVSAPFRLWYQSAAFFGDEALAPSNLVALVGRTPWGHGWLLQVGLGLLVLAGVLLARPEGRRAAGWGVIALGALILPLSPPMSGHPWAADPRFLAVLSDFLHVTAAGAWMGGLFVLMFAGIPALKEHGAPEGSETPGLFGMVNAFSRVALVAVALLGLTGLINAWIHLGAFSQLWTTPWGRTLLVKLVVVGGVVALGAYNWRVVRPALSESPRPGLLKLPASIELLIGAIAIVVTSLLVVQPLE